MYVSETRERNFMMHLRKSIFPFLLMSLFVLPNSLFADPVIFDFVGFADSLGEHGQTSEMFTVDGVTVTASAYKLTDPTAAYFMYLDDLLWRRSGWSRSMQAT